MNKEEFDFKIKALQSLYPSWFDAQRANWGMYELSGMPGWLPILERLLKAIDRVLSDYDEKGFVIAQIKEKFGGLRFYYEGAGEAAEAIFALVRTAEDEADKTCMYCGDGGSIRPLEWRLCLCEKHYEMHRKEAMPGWDEAFEEYTTPAPRELH